MICRNKLNSQDLNLASKQKMSFPDQCAQGGSIYLLLVKFDTNTRSDERLCYLQISMQTFTEGMVSHMVQHGDYEVIPPIHWYYRPYYKFLTLSEAFMGDSWGDWNRTGVTSLSKYDFYTPTNE